MPVAPIGHSGRWLTDKLGRVVLVHGVNMVNKNPPYYPSAEGFSDADAAWLAENGFRVVRVGVLGTGLMPAPGQIDANYVESIAATVTNLASHEIYALLDFHQDGYGPALGDDGFPPWMTTTSDAGHSTVGFPLYYTFDSAMQQAFQDFWNDSQGLEESYAAMFSALGSAFAKEDHVLGYDLFNEPWPGTNWIPCNVGGGCPAQDTGSLAPAYAKAVAAIRAAGDEHLVFGEPFGPFSQGTATAMPVPGGDSNAGMSFHVYPLNPSDASKVVANAVSWAGTSGGALLNTEWGATKDQSTLVTVSGALDQALVPWIFWSFCCELVTSLDGGPSAGDLVPASVAALVQPYPLAVAGTPLQYVPDPAQRALSFTWSTAKAGGGSFAPGTVTTFEVPALTYPDGYTATVSGGSVMSAPCAPLLTVSAASGASSVTVNIAPGAACHP